jgi:hypothetical protein
VLTVPMKSAKMRVLSGATYSAVAEIVGSLGGRSGSKLTVARSTLKRRPCTSTKPRSV